MGIRIEPSKRIIAIFLFKKMSYTFKGLTCCLNGGADFALLSDGLSITTPSINNEYIVSSEALTLPAGYFRLNYHVEIDSGEIFVGILDHINNKWLSGHAHNNNISWATLFETVANTSCLKLIIAGANNKRPATIRARIRSNFNVEASPQGLRRRAIPLQGNDPMAEDELTIFIHIHKAAGTSFTNLLSDNCRDGGLYNPYVIGRRDSAGKPKTVYSADHDVKNIIDYLHDQEKTVQCVASHMPYGLHRYVKRNCCYVSFMREPLSKMKSHYLYGLMRPDSALAQTVLKKHDFNLETVLLERAALEFTNDQTRVIIGTDKEDIGEYELELAKDRIQNDFLLVGATELYNESISYLMRYLYLENHVPYFKNVNKQKEIMEKRISKNAMNLLHELNQIDIQLYEWLITKYLPKRI